MPEISKLLLHAPPLRYSIGWKKKMERHFLCCSVLFAALFLSAMADDNADKCVYTFYVKTGSIIKAGTDSNISVTVGDPSGRSVWIPNLKSWGLMGFAHDYFERDTVDLFSGPGPCIDSPMCRLNLTSDGSGPHPGWFCEYVEVTSTGPHKACSKTGFYVDQWLATNAPPFELSAVLDGCSDWVDRAAERGGGRRIVVSNRKAYGSS